MYTCFLDLGNFTLHSSTLRKCAVIALCIGSWLGLITGLENGEE
jgi:hypothetical protein